MVKFVTSEDSTRTLFMKKIKRLLTVCAFMPFLISMSCIGLAQPIPKSHRYILGVETLVGASFEAFDGRWLPKEEQSDLALQTVLGHLGGLYNSENSKNTNVQNIYENFADYSVQFSGIIRDGELIIHCNFFLKNISEELDPAKVFVFVFGGGDAYWNIEYVVAEGKCQFLWINAPI